MSAPAERAAERISEELLRNHGWNHLKAADIIRAEYSESVVVHYRARLFGSIQVTGCSHSTACSIWGDDGQGHTKENYPEPLPCNCGALINFERKLMPCGHPQACCQEEVVVT